MGDQRIDAAEAVAMSLRTGERAASIRAAEHLAADVVLDTGRDEVVGSADVLERISGIWPFTPVYSRGAWSDPVPHGDGLRVEAVFPALGAAPAGLNVTFSFNGDGKIDRIGQEVVPANPPQQVERIPAAVKAQINGALANGTPVCLCYVDQEGQPQQSLRGSTIAYSDTQLAVWLRNPAGGLARALATNDRLSLLYRDSRTRSTIVVHGRGHVDDDPEVRRRVYERTPEVEQLHDTSRGGAALIIDVTRLQAGGPDGSYRLER